MFKRIGICLAIVVEWLENILFVRQINQLNQLAIHIENGATEVRITYYFSVKARKYHGAGRTSITIPTSITVDARKYDASYAIARALEIFSDLDDRWTLSADTIHPDLYEVQRAAYENQLNDMYGIGAAGSSSATETNS